MVRAFPKAAGDLAIEAEMHPLLEGLMEAPSLGNFLVAGG